MSENQNVSEGTEEKNSSVTADGTEALLQAVFESRSAQQLADRLLDFLYPLQKKRDTKGKEKVGRSAAPAHLIDNISDEQKAKVETICQNAAPREDQLEKLSLALAYLHSAVTDKEWMKALTQKLADRFIAWEKPERCVEASDKLPVKQVYDWFKVTLDAKGIDYLAEIVSMTEFDRGVLEFFRELPGLMLVFILAVFYTFSAERIYKIGALFMLAFALGTVPLMLLFASLGALMPRSWTKYLRKLGAVFVTAMGATMLLAGLLLLR